MYSRTESNKLNDSNAEIYMQSLSSSTTHHSANADHIMY